MAGLDKNIWVIANWKSNKTIKEALEWIDCVGPKLPKQGLKVVVCPTFVCLEEVKKAILVGNFPLMVGSQDLSPRILKDVVDLAILGHSERRENFAETDATVAAKAKQALAHHIIPLVCVQSADTPLPQGVNLIAYEPIFAIGTGNPDIPQNASKVSASLKNKYGHLEVLYGGSVTHTNVRSFVKQENINGVLVGKASLEGEEFLAIVKECSK